MAFNTYAEGLKIASDLAQRAVLAESSLSSLPPLASPIPALQKAFPLYISAAEQYSHLLSSKLVPEADKVQVKRKWRLVLERAEKVKTRIESLGGQVGKVGVGDEGEEEAVRRRGGRMNGVDMEVWREPSEREFDLGRSGMYRSSIQPDLALDQAGLELEWAELPGEAWSSEINKGERWVVGQGVGADCSVVAGLGVCLEYTRRWGKKLARGNLHPQGNPAGSRRSENGKHVLKLLLNGEWRGVVIDSLLPRDRITHHPLHATSHILLPGGSAVPSPTSSEREIGPPWIPLALKAYFLAHGGYSLRGSNPAPDIYAFTGWIPERISFKGGFQREKQWRRSYEAWSRGEVMVTLGTGKEVGERLIPLHAYAVLDVREDGDQRTIDIFDPGLPAEAARAALEDDLERLNIASGRSNSRRTGLFTMAWDEVCGEFDALNLNWDPDLRPVSTKRHWSWPKPNSTDGSRSDIATQPRYRLDVTQAKAGTDVWILLSQHIVNKDRALDDIALHVTEERFFHTTSVQISTDSPYSNAQHVVARYTIRSNSASLLISPARDRGLSRTDFTLQAFSPFGSVLSLTRISTTLPFSQTVSGALTSRLAGGHAGWPSYGSNPQYTVTIGDPSSPSKVGGGAARQRKVDIRVQVSGDAEMPWNGKLLWGGPGLVYDVSEDAVVADTGPYSYGMAFAQSSIEMGTYTLVVSSFEPVVTGNFNLSIESAVPINIVPIPPEGAGLYHRSVESRWSETTAGGRPSQQSYHLNPHIDLLIPSPLTLQCRLHHPDPGNPTPLNLTLFTRKEGGGVGEQIATSGSYSDAVSGVRINRTKPGVIKAGVYVLVPSGYDPGEGKGRRWRVDVWADAPFSLELPR